MTYKSLHTLYSQNKPHKDYYHSNASSDSSDISDFSFTSVIIESEVGMYEEFPVVMNLIVMC